MRKKLFTLLLAIVASIGMIYSSEPEWNEAGKTISISSPLALHNIDSWFFEEEKRSTTSSHPVTFVVLEEAKGTHVDVPFDDINNLEVKPVADDDPNLGKVAFKHVSLNTTFATYAIYRYSIPYQIARIYPVYDSFGNVIGYNMYRYKVTEIVDEEISGSAYVKTLVIPHTIERVPKNASLNFNNVDTVYMYNSHCKYEKSAYKLLPKEKLSTIVFADGFDTIPYNICSYARKLDSIYIPSSVSFIRTGAFSYCSNLKHVTIPNALVEHRAFEYCSNLDTITLGDNFRGFEPDAFYECGILRAFIVGPHSAKFSSSNGVLFDKQRSKLIRYPQGKEGKSYTIPNTVTSIETCAFYCCTNITSVLIPSSVTSIGYSAFRGCSGLTSVTIPNSVTSIENFAFSGCSNCKSITIGENVDHIDVGAFAQCAALNSVTCFRATPPRFVWAIASNTIDGEIVRDTIGLFKDVDCSKILLYVPAGSEKLYRDWNYNDKGEMLWGDFKNILPINQAEGTMVAEVRATAINQTSVIVEWPEIENANTYEINIVTDGDTVCQLIFGTNGQLLSNNYDKPSRDSHHYNHYKVRKATTTTNGWQYVIGGLQEYIRYSYSLTAKNSDDAVLLVKTIDFVTQSTEAIGVVNADNETMKIIRNGQILILRGDKVYTLQGQEVR